MPDSTVKDRVFRDPVHGLIELRGPDRAIADLLDTRAMQRLRRIKQMGFAWLVYPGAEHSRFGHALGAFHIATRVVNQLKLEPEVARHVKIAALLHDVGHGPFSHAWEHVFGGVPGTWGPTAGLGGTGIADHERWGARIVMEDAELHDALDRLEPGLPEVLKGFWAKTYRPHFARKLVSSQLDVDRLDYLLRDGHYSGAGYATYDLDWIIHALQIDRVHSETDDPSDLVIDYRRGMYAVEQYLFARSYMYAQVYHHKTVRAAEWMFIKTLERFAQLARQEAEPPGLELAARMARGNEISVPEYLRLHDITLMDALDEWAGHGAGPGAADPVLRDLASRLVERRLFKTFDLGDDVRVAERIGPAALEVAEKRFGSAARWYVHVDAARQVGYRGGDDEELHVIDHPRYGAVTLSRLLDDMPLGQPMAAVRLVCARELVDDLRPVVESALGRPRGRR
ncbi:MAG: HD domain-containing protein [Deltaproteobacteria bacterium]|nr:HD domain-containing protein [Deltaproteobacteria bacterium]